MLDYNLFPDNKYTKWYIALIESRKFQEKEKFKTEKHHIFPVSIFGNNKHIVNLTYKEHFIAHLLLWKMFKEDNIAYYKMTYAFKAMSELSSIHNNRGVIKINSVIFSALKEEISRLNSIKMIDRWQDPEYRGNQTNHWQEYWSNPENKKAQSERRKEHFKDKDNYNKMAETNRKLTSDPEWRKKRSEAQKKLSADKEYTKMRIDAMQTPEARAKGLATMKAKFDDMSKEERHKMFARPKTPEQLKAHSDKLKGRKVMINFELMKRKFIQPSDINQYLSDGWMLWGNLTKEQKQQFNQDK